MTRAAGAPGGGFGFEMNSRVEYTPNADLVTVSQNGKPTKNDYCKTIRDLPVGAIDTTLVLRIIEPI